MVQLRDLRHIFLTCGFLVGCLLAASSLRAQHGQWRERQLVNGMTVRYQQDTTRRLLHMGLRLRGGGALDAPDAQGLAMLYEHLFFRSGPVDAVQARQAGMYLSHKTLLESHFFAASMPPEVAPMALDILAQGLAGQEWPDSVLGAARRDIAPELQVQEHAPSYYLASEVRATLWRSFASRKQVSGRYTHILGLGSAQIAEALAPYRHPGNTCLMAVGPGDGQAFLSAAEAALGHWSPQGQGALLPTVDPPRLKESIYFQTVNELAPQPIVMIAWPVPVTEAPLRTQRDAERFCTLAQLHIGRFHQQMVDSGRVLDYSWRWEGGLNPGQLVLDLLPAPGRFQEAMEVVHRELRAMGQADYYSNAHIVAGQRRCQLDAATRDDRSLPRLLASTEAWMLASDEPVPNTEVNARDLAAFAMTHISGRPHVAGVLMSSEALVDTRALDVFQPAIAAIVERDPTPRDSPATQLHNITASELRTYRVFFQDDRLSRQPEADSLLRQVVDMLHDHPDQRIYINSYAEGLGDGVKNYQFSVTRAKELRAQLVSQHGVNPRQLVIRAYGEAFPEFAGDSDLRNRRITFEYAPADAQDNVF